MTYVPDGGYPDLATIRDWIQVPTVLPDSELDIFAGAERNAQQWLDWGTDPDTGARLDLPDDLLAAFLRRVGRAVAAKGIPLGILAGDAEFGAIRLSQWDAEVVRLEAPYVVAVIA